MNNSINKKSVILIVAVLMMGLLITGGTYAFLTTSVAVSNGNYVTNTHCFNVTYTGDSDSITGTLFPSANAANGLTGGVTAATSSSCAITRGRGTLYLHVDSGTSTALTSTVDGHCEVVNSLGTLSNIDNATSCNAVEGAHWVTDGTALKYMVIHDGDLYSSGYIKTTDIGNDITIHDDFSVTATSKTWDVYIWLDGYLSGEDYVDLPFGGTIRMNTAQIKSTDTTFTGDTPIISGYLTQANEQKMGYIYQRIEYLQSTGTQYIDTGYYPNANTGVDTTFKFNDLTVQSRLFGVQGIDSDSTSFSYVFYINGSSKWAYGFKNGTGNWANTNVAVNTNVHTLKFNVTRNYYSIDGGTNKAIASTTRTQTANYSMLLFATRANGSASTSGLSKSQIYSFKIYDNNSLVRDFIPVYRKSDNKPGLYDMVNGVFYTNAAASGADFTVGPDVNQ